MGLFGNKKKSKMFSAVHVAGLSTPENCKCQIISENDNLTIKCSSQEFILKVEKIKNIDFQMDIDEKQYLKSSLAKGMVGAAVFGVPGAVAGSAPQTKTKREVKCYAIIAYENMKGEYMTIVLRDEFPNTAQCAKLVDELRPKIKSSTNRVEL